MPEIRYLIWSQRKGMYWAPNELGYTPDKDKAGRYSPADAERICRDRPVEPNIKELAPECEGVHG